MPATAVDPPGLLAWHVPLVAAAPALLALAAGLSAAIAPPGRWRSAIAWGGMAMAMVLAALALRPDGAALAFARTPVAHGWLQLGVVPCAAALLAGIIAAWSFRRCHPAGLGLRTGTALLLPLTVLPALALLAELDHPADDRWRWPRRALAVGATVDALFMPGWAVMVVAMLVIAALLPAGPLRRPWVAILGCAALAAAAGAP
jgi:hypothetical protein